jgi:cell wall-associated NlpC family hydrolase
MSAAMIGSPFARVLSRARTGPNACLTAALVLVAAACATASPAAARRPATLANWDSAQQRDVVAAGLMSDSGGSFNGAAHLSPAQADAAMAALAAHLEALRSGPPVSAQEGAGKGSTSEGGSTGAVGVTGEPVAPKSPVKAVSTRQNPVTVVTFDRLVVEQLGLGAVAAHVQAAAQTAGLRPPAYFGSEVVARFLELRYDHPAGTDRLEPFPGDPITRAEAAWSLAQAWRLGEWNLAYAQETLSAFELPRLSTAQREALNVAASRIGYPYVWGGTTDNTADGLEHGGFDCSGFAWRVYKLSGLPWGAEIGGRTAAEQAGEFSRAQRLRMAQLEPGDLLFFGHAHFDGRATEKNIVHEGIYLGDNWVIHSSSQGVYVLPLQGSWLGNSFAWGRRVIR